MSWVMPKVFKGQMVLWYPGGVQVDDRALPAVIVQANHRSLWLVVLDPNGIRAVEGVRHMADPDVKDAERMDDGCWELTQYDRNIMGAINLLSAGALTAEGQKLDKKG